ncbi:MAG: 16S rRNA (adenine(1518)-N(6)/adenine(1519)-N(6))-dimethyltransferase RsmA [Defluviitaleaceae bacterium]|nr:16S rRNA (adenine(1518)-N(6)/adenine(1519)-N(6))-dimethyltransferase RsmA [Defluviitaleaceae bacterium]
MNDLTIKTNVRRILAENGLYPKKNLGQNFLTDAHVLSKIVAAADITRDDLIIEVGPGLGVLTTEMAKHAAKVVAIEIDTNLAAILQANAAPNVQIINQDVLKTDIGDIIAQSGFFRAKMVANLPYYITTPIIFNILETGLPVDTLVVMVQKEVADRMLAAPSTKAYGLLTLSVAYYGRASLVANVPPNSFHPRPDVHSAVVKIDVNPRQDVDHPIFAAITKAAFGNRRKTLQNCLAASEQLGITKEKAAQLLAAARLPENIRGEALSFEDFVRLAGQLQDARSTTG